ncbi:Bacterial Ig-like domain (group 2) [Bacteroidales bacterium Barb6XT]|nr:Bacterial Ig-like domain (group 2) [Bacteroidales bacterium Barb6XT]
MKKILLFIVFAIGLGLSAEGKTVYVRADGSDDKLGDTWTNAYRTLQKALERTDVDIICLEEGATFVIDTNSLNAGAFKVTKDLIITGGYTDNGISTGSSVLSGRGLGRVMIIAGTEGDPPINVILRNLTISLGKAVEDDLTINGTLIRKGHGGGIYIENANTTLENVTVKNNMAIGDTASATAGGGIYNRKGTLTLTPYTIIRDNSAVTGLGDGYGGGIANEGTLIIDKAVITRNRAVDNEASAYAGYGGGIENRGYLKVISGSEITDNIATTGLGEGRGGGIHQMEGEFTHTLFWGDGSIKIERNTAASSTIRNNTATGGGIYAAKNNLRDLSKGLSVVNNKADLSHIGTDDSDNMYLAEVESLPRKHYISPAGSDLNNWGAFPSDPFATLYAALSYAAGGDTIYLAKGNYPIDERGAYQIVCPLTIIGNSEGDSNEVTTLNGNGKDRVMIIAGAAASSSIHVALQGLTLTGGDASNSDVTVNTVHISKCMGGGLYNVNANTVLEDVRVAGNVASSVGDSVSGFGGGIYNNGTLTVFEYARVEGNVASSVSDSTGGFGGGIYNNGTLEIGPRSVIAGNTATTGTGEGCGGGIYDGGSRMIISGGIIKGNTAVSDSANNNPGKGGGLYGAGLSLEIKARQVLQSNKGHVVSENSFGEDMYISKQNYLKDFRYLDANIYANTDITITDTLYVNADMTVANTLTLDGAVLLLSADSASLLANNMMLMAQSVISFPFFIEGSRTVLTVKNETVPNLTGKFIVKTDKEFLTYRPTVVWTPAEGINKLQLMPITSFATKISLLPIPNLVTGDHTAAIDKGIFYPFSVALEPAGAAEPIIWSSMDETIVKVDGRGVVSAVNTGTATIVITTGFSGKTDSCRIIVSDGLVLKDIFRLMIAGDTLRLTATLLQTVMTGKDITWTSTDETVATVNQDGLVTAVKPGLADIVARTKDKRYSAKCEVNVIIPIERIDINDNSKTLERGDKYRLTATVYPADATFEKDVLWASTNNDVVTVDASGQLTAVNTGRAKIVATTRIAGLTDSCEILVKGRSTILLSDLYKRLGKGEVFQVTAVAFPEEVTNQELIWSSSDEHIASVDENGFVTAAGIGEANITATTTDGKFTTFCAIVVYIPVQNITLSGEPVVRQGVFTLTATLTPEDATYKKVRWSVSDANVLSLISSSDLSVTFWALTEGKADIYAESEDGRVLTSHAVIVSNDMGNEEINTGGRTISYQDGALHLRNLEGSHGYVTDIAGRVREVFEVTSSEEIRTVYLPAGVYMLTSVRGNEKSVFKFAVR